MQNVPEAIRYYIQKLEQENKELKERITELENKLRAYENPHTPPSQQRFKGKLRWTHQPTRKTWRTHGSSWRHSYGARTQ